MGYSKGDFAKSLGISRGELEKRAKAAGFNTTEAYFKATGGSGTMPKTPTQVAAQSKTVQDEFLGRYGGAISTQPKISDIWNRLQGEYGIGGQRQLYTGLRGAALTTEGALARLPEQITGETRGFDVNAAQRARIEQSRGGKLSSQLTEEARAAERAGLGLSELTGQGLTQLQLEESQNRQMLMPYQVEAGMISDRLAAETTGWSNERAGQLNILLQKLQNQGLVDVAELANLQALAMQEDKYTRERELLTYKNNLGYSGSTASRYTVL